MQQLTRREYLASGVVLGSTATAGCLGTGDGPNTGSTIDTPEYVRDIEFEWRDFHEISPSPDAVTPDGPPDFDTTGASVYIEGWITYGSSTCDEPFLAAVDTNDGRETLEITVDQREKPDLDRNSCTDDLATALYSISISFDGTLERIEVVEEHHPNGPSTTTGSVTL